MKLKFLLLFIAFAITSAVSFGQANQAPTFVGGSTQAFAVCQNASSYSIDNYLVTQDLDAGQTLTYTIKTPPSHGTLHGFPGSGGTNGGVFTPSGFDYTPSASYSGSDVFIIQVSDGTVTAQTRITVTINSLPTITANVGNPYVCTGSTNTLTNTTKNGIWSSSNIFAATVDSLTGVVTGVSAGVSVISYTVINASGCSSVATTNFTVSGYPTVSGISGTASLCVASTTTLTDATAGGVWSSSNNTIATVSGGIVAGVATGTVTGVASGTATITYTVTNAYGCSAFATRTVTVNTSPNVSPITATTTSVCIGSNITLTNNTGGGTWKSSNTAIATVATNFGRVTGVSAGTDTITYTVTNGNGCTASQFVAITVSAAPNISPITGTATLCSGSTTTLSSNTLGGTWSSGNTNVATVVSGTGVVTGVGAGSLNILYTVVSAGGCSSTVTKTITVNTTPTITAISGLNSICVGSLDTLTNLTQGGIWTSSNTKIATVGSGSGIVTGIAVGTDTISYTVSSGNCSATSTFIVTVGTGVTVAAISGPASVCLNSSITLTDATSGGGWTSSDPNIGYVEYATGVVTGLSAGVVTIKYTVGNGTCSGTAIKNIIVSDIPNVGSNNISSYALCTSDSVQLTNTISGGVWTSSNTTNATVGAGTGLVVGGNRVLGNNNIAITYTVTNVYGCFATAVTNVTVNNKPNNFTVTGSNSLCIPNITTFTTTSTGGTWSSNKTSVATVQGAGIVKAVSAGTAFIGYTVTSGNGCSRTNGITVNVASTLYVSQIVGSATACTTPNGQQTKTYQYTDSTSNGTWSVSDVTVATISTTGLLTPIKAGTVIITYTATSGTCSTSVTKSVTVYSFPTVGTTTPNNGQVCIAATLQLSNTVSGGIWTSNPTTVATIDSITGLVTGVSTTFGGNAQITYTVTNAGGCTNQATSRVTVNSGTALGNITGTTNFCVGATTTLSNNTAGGVWTSTNKTIATVDSTTGVVTGVTTGNVTIVYTVSNGGGCASAANRNVTVNAAPTVVATSGVNKVCVGYQSQLINASTIPNGGTVTWSSSNTAIATVSTTGVVTGVAAGTANIYYTVKNPQFGPNTPCSSVVTTVFTVNANPIVGNISGGTSNICVGASSKFSVAATGGTWDINDTALATISQSGLVTGLTAGDIILTYSVSANGCTTTVFGNSTVVGLPLVGVIEGDSVLCVGKSTSLSNLTAGGIWTSSVPSVASVDASGNVTALKAGTTKVIYSVTNAAGCVGFASSNFIVNANPIVASITGAKNICLKAATLLSDSTIGGTWTSSNNAIATIDNSGFVTSISLGIDTIGYSVSNSTTGCSTSVNYVVSVNPVPVSSFTVSKSSQCLSGNSYVFTNTSTISSGSVTYNWLIDGKTFTSTSPSYVFTTAGTYTIQLVVISGSGCNDTSTQTITVYPQPIASFSINNNSQCVTSNSFTFTNNTTISSGTNTYKWSFGDGTISTTTSPSYTYSKSGTYSVKLLATSSNGCLDSILQSLTVIPSVVPTVSIKATPTTICSGATVSFVATPVNGGLAPIYQWKKNGLIVGTNAASYSDNTLTNTDSITCVLTSSVSCVSTPTASSNSIAVTVTQYTTPSISISTANSTICAGTSVSFNANASGSGSTPTYQWKVNGVNVGVNSNTYSTSASTNNDAVTCDLTSSLTCVTARTLTSTSIVMNVKATSSSTTNASICAGTSYTFNGNAYTASGKYTATLTNSVGCDSIATLNLTVKAGSSSTTKVAICPGSTYSFNGTVYTTSGTYTSTLTNSVGCDSIATLILSLKATSTSTTKVSICPSSSYAFNGKTYTSAGTYTSTLTNSVGCDSIATLVLTIKTTSSSTTTASICAGTSYIFNGKTYTTAGTFTSTLTNSVGCDSIATLVLAIKATSTSNTSASICAGTTYTFNGKTYSSAGTYTSTLTNSVGCDSIATLVLTVKATSTSNTTTSICAGTSYTFNGKIYTTAGTYTSTLTNSAGCDSIAILVLSVKATSTSTTTASICTGSSYTFNGKTYTTAGTYTSTLTNSVGCDSIATLVLSLTTPVTPTIGINASATIINIGNSVTFTASPINGGSNPQYQWKKNGVNISGATSATYTTSTLANKDTISCELTSSTACVTSSTAASNKIVVTVNSLYTISGSLKSPIGNSIPLIILNLNGVPNSVTGKSNSNYSFTLSPGASYTITPSKNNDSVKNNGVSVIDAILVQSHVLNKTLLNSPYKIIAADVNNSGDVSTIDILYIKRLALGIDTTFTGKRLWAFVDGSYVFPDSTNPFPHKDSVTVSSLSSNVVNQNFVGVKLGDVNYDWDAAVLRTNNKSINPIELYYNDVSAVSTTEVRIPVRVKNFKNILGMQYTLKYNSKLLTLKGIENNSLNVDFGVTNINQGNVTFLWNDNKGEAKTLSDGSVLMDLVFETNGAFENEDFNITSDITSIEAYDASYSKVGIVKGAGKITAKPQAVEIVSTENWSVIPNPTPDGLVKVSTTLKAVKTVFFQLTDVKGNIIFQQKEKALGGNTTRTLNLQEHTKLANGTYFLKVQGIENQSIKQIIFEK